MNIQLIKSTTEELSEISDLAYKIWNLHYPPIVGQLQVDYMLDRFYDLYALKKQQNEGQQFYFVRYEQRNIGFVAISEKSENNYFIHKFYIDNELQGKGIGETVFSILQTLCHNQAQTVFQLTVNRQNFKAINFYYKLGFKIIKVEDFDIGNGYLMNDFIMEWNNYE